MKKSTTLKAIFFLFAFLSTASTYSKMIWPAKIFVSQAIFGAFLVGFISIPIGACFFYWLIKNISYGKALKMSLIGDGASVILGTLVMKYAMLLWHFLFDSFLGGTFSIYNYVATVVLMYLGSSLIEFIVIKLSFGYSFKQLWLPVLIGNLVMYGLTYVLVVLFQFVPYQI